VREFFISSATAWPWLAFICKRETRIPSNYGQAIVDHSYDPNKATAKPWLNGVPFTICPLLLCSDHCIFFFREVILRRLVGYNRAAFEANDALGALREVEVVCDEHERGAGFAV